MARVAVGRAVQYSRVSRVRVTRPVTELSHAYLWWQQGLPGLVLLEADGHVPRDRPKVAHLLVTQMAGDTRGAELVLALLAGGEG